MPPHGRQGGLSRYVTMWVVRVVDDLYVRSAYGPGNPWYRRATAAGAGRVRAGGVESDVTFGSADPAAIAGVTPTAVATAPWLAIDDVAWPAAPRT